MRILIVDDDEISLELVYNTLKNAGYEVQTAKNGQQALQAVRTGLFRLVISDWMMPEMTGIELCKNIRARDCSAYVYVILLSSRDETQDIVHGLGAGADDFITKPFEPAELCVRVRTGERILALESRDLTIFSLAKLADSRDPETGAHLERIREYCRVLALQLATQEKFREQIDGDYVQMIYRTSPLHDIGKVGIPDSVLRKAGRLNDAEFEIMKTHTLIGAETLEAASRQHSEAGFLRMARDIALTHHEQYDGAGYPSGLTAGAIPLCGRIVSLADVYDALTAKRIYKDAFTHEVACSIILDGSGTHFDPDVVDAFIATRDQFLAIQQRLADAPPAPFLDNRGSVGAIAS